MKTRQELFEINGYRMNGKPAIILFEGETRPQVDGLKMGDVVIKADRLKTGAEFETHKILKYEV